MFNLNTFLDRRDILVTRQDAWSNEEDLLLTEVVLRQIREGGTQLSAFKEVGQLLSRTSAACGFRWNSHVRKIQEKYIEEAKKYRKSQMRNNEAIHVENKNIGSTEQIAVDFLIDWLENVRENNYQVFHLNDEFNRVRKENELLVNKLKKLEKEYFTILDFVDKKRAIATDVNFNLYTE